MYSREEFADYLADLLILQYRHDKNIDCIKALAKTTPVEIIQEIIDGYNVETAVGHQLDVLGKYIFGDTYLGESRSYEKTIQGITGNYLLTDEEYRKALLLKIILNGAVLSNASIDNGLYEFFGRTIRADSENNMFMHFYVTKSVENVFLALSYHAQLPRPAGVSFDYVVVTTDVQTFGICSYDELPTPSVYLRTGFKTYDNLDKEGDTLTYEKILHPI